ncbi:MAG: EscU/YscU/HrcU family type III secretion system export apparatus switch protein [Burkholderiales bacterium]
MSAAEITRQTGAGENAPKASAVALAYAAGDGAPRVVAKGRGLVAEEILRRAQAAGIPVHASREMVSLLMQVDLDRHIPPELYRAVAELLAWLHRLEHGAGAPRGA